MTGSLLLGVLIGSSGTLGCLFGLRWFGRHRTAPLLAPEDDQEPRYGHPWPPVSKLRQKLPTLPAGYVWETVVRTNKDGDDILDLSLMEVASEKVLARASRNLTMGRYETYASKYTKYPSLKKETFNNDLLQPLLDWAYPEANRVKSGGTVTDYKIG